MRHDTQQIKTFAFETAPGELGNIFHFIGGDFIQNYDDDLDAFALKNGVVEIDFVNRSADSALADDDDFGSENFCHLRVGQIKKTEPTAGMAGAFTQNKIFFPGNAVKGLDDFFD